MSKPEFSIRYQWTKLTETYLYPDKWWGDVSRSSAWRGLLSVSGDIQKLKNLEVGGMHAQVYSNLNLVAWHRSNQTDVQLKENMYQTYIPRISEPDDDFVIVRLHDGVSEYNVECLANDKPDDKYVLDALDSQIDWVDGKAVLSFISSAPCTATWVVQNNGRWTEQTISTIKSGKSSVDLDIPYGEVVYLELFSSAKDTPIVHRYYVTGKPGVASGRKVWYRGAMFESKMQKNTPWTSIIIPIMHPDDVERIPAFIQWNQLDWWIYKTATMDDSIELIKKRFGNGKITILGDYNDDTVDIQILKPFQVNASKLNPDKTYSVCLFDDAGDVEYARRAGWSMYKVSLPELSKYSFLDRIWQQGIISQTNTDGLKQYGFGFSFARPPANENLWTLALRDIEWREHRESFMCSACPYKAACHQSLPMPYAPDDIKRVPWIAADRSSCPLHDTLAKN